MKEDFSSALKRAKEIASKMNAALNSDIDSNDPKAPKLEELDANLQEKVNQARLIATTLANQVTAEIDLDMYEEINDTLLVPSHIVGLVIGKGGEQIRYFQEAALCKMFMIQDGEYATAPEKLLCLSGPRFRVQEGKRLVQEFMEDKLLIMSGPPGSIRVELAVPKEAVGLVIGRGGDTIRRINVETGCCVHFHPNYETPNGERICVFEGLPMSLQMAQQRVRELVEMVVTVKNPSTYQLFIPEGKDVVEVVVPIHKAEAILGEGGKFMRSISSGSGATVELNSGVGDCENTRTFLIIGDQEEINKARQIMVDVAGEDSVSKPKVPTNVQITVLPRDPPAWGSFPIPSTYDPASFYNQPVSQVPSNNMATSYFPDSSNAQPQDFSSFANNNESYYGDMTPEEYNKAWADYYQQCLDYAKANEGAVSEADLKTYEYAYQYYISQLSANKKEEETKNEENLTVENNEEESDNCVDMVDVSKTRVDGSPKVEEIIEQ